ncbi:hypothetical protein [Pseudomonas sp.]|uniref:hypothetical protein n=1 Tax=Pseudomonas sp. TaxID=306 RepID=UPI0031D731D9
MVVRNPVLQALEGSEPFISGFEDDDVQEGIDDLLKQVKEAITAVTSLLLSTRRAT